MNMDRSSPGTASSAADADMTLVDLLWEQGKVERWIRFGNKCHEQRLDPQRSIVAFAPGAIFAFIRWAAGDFGTVVSCIDILRAVARGQACQSVPFVRPGAEILLRQNGWPKVERVLRAIDAVERIGIEPAEVCPDHWRHIHNRLCIADPTFDYTRAQHLAWIRRRRILQ